MSEDWLKVAKRSYPEFVVSEKVVENTRLRDRRPYSGRASARDSLGLIYTDEEFERYRREVLDKPMI